MIDDTGNSQAASVTKQLSLFPKSEKTSSTSQADEPSPITAKTPLNAAIDAFEAYMQARGFTENTQQAFRLDMGILADYVRGSTAIEKIDTATLNAFLTWMQGPRDVPCSPKTLERRITTLKVFFGWLAEDEILPRDPAAPLIHQSVTAPLPEVLNDDEIQAVLAVTQRLRQGDAENKADARPHLLVTLILHTGIKKSECVNIQLPHIDLTDAERPALWVRYRQPRRQYKERRIELPTWWPAVLRAYREQYNPRQALFPWTARNLEYVLTGVAKEADVSRLTFEMLRWTCAVRDYTEGMKSEALRQKLGLSEISWYEVEPKLALLAQQIGKRKPNDKRFRNGVTG